MSCVRVYGRNTPPPPSETLYPPLSVDIDQVPKPLKITFTASSGPPLFNGYYCVEKVVNSNTS